MPLFAYFPDNYMWSHAVQHAINAGAPIGEIHFACRELQAASRTADAEAWYQAWWPIAARLGDEASAQQARGFVISAREAYRRATLYYQMAERFLPFDDSRRRVCFERAVHAFRGFCALSAPAIEVVEVPYEDTSLPAYLLPAGPSFPPPWPTVVSFNGLDGNAEHLVLRAAGLAERGMACLVMDGPGYGYSLRVQGIRTRPDYEVAGRAAADYLETRGEIDATRLAVMGSSLGGYYAPRCAAFESRFKAAVAWGAIWDYRQVWEGRREVTVNSPLASPQRQICWVLGVETLDEAIDRLSSFTLASIAHRISCSLLIVHGENDRQIPLADAVKLYNAASSTDKELKVFTATEGGDEHCQFDNPLPAKLYIYDWLAARLVASERR